MPKSFVRYGGNTGRAGLYGFGEAHLCMVEISRILVFSNFSAKQRLKNTLKMWLTASASVMKMKRIWKESPPLRTVLCNHEIGEKFVSTGNRGRLRGNDGARLCAFPLYVNTEDRLLKNLFLGAWGKILENVARFSVVTNVSILSSFRRTTAWCMEDLWSYRLLLLPSPQILYPSSFIWWLLLGMAHWKDTLPGCYRLFVLRIFPLVRNLSLLAMTILVPPIHPRNAGKKAH